MSWKRSSHFMARKDSLGTVYCSLTIIMQGHTKRFVKKGYTERSSQKAVFSLALSPYSNTLIFNCNAYEVELMILV